MTEPTGKTDLSGSSHEQLLAELERSLERAVGEICNHIEQMRMEVRATTLSMRKGAFPHEGRSFSFVKPKRTKPYSVY